MTTPVEITLLGSMDDDRLFGGEDRDSANGEQGNDILVGHLGSDFLQGGDGDDLVIGGVVNSAFFELDQETISEEDPSGIMYFDRPHPTMFAEMLIGNDGLDTIVGSSWDDANGDGAVKATELELGDPLLQESWGFNNVAWGGAGDDALYGANGFDTMGGGAGDDKLFGYGTADILYGGAGSDTLYGGDGKAELFHREAGGSYTLVETLYGGAGNDNLYGEAGDDRLYGGAGHDMLSGGAGQDTMTGGDGADIFTYMQGMDTITDFNTDEDTLSIELGLSRDDLKEAARNQTVDGKAGLQIVIGDDDSLFLVGLSIDDFDAITMAL